MADLTQYFKIIPRERDELLAWKENSTAVKFSNVVVNELFILEFVLCA